MSYQNEKIGMMDEGYFVPRGEIINWINDLLQLNMTKIQQLGSGAVYCQITDVIHPGKVAMNKVNWKAKNDYQFINNLKVLQTAFEKIGIKRYVEVQKLAKAKYQDNLEFAQWLKRYYDLNCGDRGNNYEAEERRGGNNPDFGFAEKNVVPKTYNGTGVIIPKKQNSPPKKKDMAPVEAPVKKKTTTTINQSPEQKIKKVLKEKEQKGENLKNEVDKQKIKELEVKLSMISEIMKSEEVPEMKLNLINEILEMNEHQDVM